MSIGTDLFDNFKIKIYKRKLIYQIELKAKLELQNKNLKVNSNDDYERNIQKCGIILSDLATIKRGIKNKKTSVNIYGTENNRSYMYQETKVIIKKAGFNYDVDRYGLLDLYPIEEKKKQWVEGIPESWSIYDEG